MRYRLQARLHKCLAVYSGRWRDYVLAAEIPTSPARSRREIGGTHRGWLGLQARVFLFGCEQQGKRGIGIFPGKEECFICLLCLALVSPQGVSLGKA